MAIDNTGFLIKGPKTAFCFGIEGVHIEKVRFFYIFNTLTSHARHWSNEILPWKDILFPSNAAKNSDVPAVAVWNFDIFFCTLYPLDGRHCANTLTFSGKRTLPREQKSHKE